ncbi:MAG: hypothetical protein ABIQ02_06260, partial [Saprospiraceae bacterium]
FENLLAVVVVRPAFSQPCAIVRLAVSQPCAMVRPSILIHVLQLTNRSSATIVNREWSVVNYKRYFPSA